MSTRLNLIPRKLGSQKQPAFLDNNNKQPAQKWAGCFLVLPRKGWACFSPKLDPKVDVGAINCVLNLRLGQLLPAATPQLHLLKRSRGDSSPGLLTPGVAYPWGAPVRVRCAPGLCIGACRCGMHACMLAPCMQFGMAVLRLGSSKFEPSTCSVPRALLCKARGTSTEKMLGASL